MEVPMKPTFEEAVAELVRSPKFKSWGKLTLEELEQSRISKEVVEKHYTVSEIAEVWGISVDLARDIFRKEPGVLALDRTGRGKYVTMRVPESVMERVHRRLSQG
jgi:hypothetical protein